MSKLHKFTKRHIVSAGSSKTGIAGMLQQRWAFHLPREQWWQMQSVM